MTPASRAAGTFQPGSANFGWSLSPDGRQVAYRDVSIEDGGEIWVLDLERGTRSRLTFSPGQDWAPRWSADGRTVLFASDRKGDARRDVWAQAADGTGEPRLVLDPERDPTDFVTTEDGEWVVFRAAAPPSRDILAQRPGADTAATPILASPDFDETSPALSPDGRWLAYWSNETGGGGQVYVRPFPDVGGGRWQISSDFGVAPRWSRSGRELFYWGEGGLHVVEVDTSTGFRVGSERVISPNAPLWGGGSTTNDWYDVSADDQRFLVALRGQDPTAERQPELIFVQKFLEEVKARVPAP